MSAAGRPISTHLVNGSIATKKQAPPSGAGGVKPVMVSMHQNLKGPPILLVACK